MSRYTLAAEKHLSTPTAQPFHSLPRIQEAALDDAEAGASRLHGYADSMSGAVGQSSIRASGANDRRQDFVVMGAQFDEETTHVDIDTLNELSNLPEASRTALELEERAWKQHEVDCMGAHFDSREVNQFFKAGYAGSGQEWRMWNPPDSLPDASYVETDLEWRARSLPDTLPGLSSGPTSIVSATDEPGSERMGRQRTSKALEVAKSNSGREVDHKPLESLTSRPQRDMGPQRRSPQDTTPSMLYWNAPGFRRLGGGLSISLRNSGNGGDNAAQLFDQIECADHLRSSPAESILLVRDQSDGLSDPSVIRTVFITCKTIISGFINALAGSSESRKEAGGESSSSKQPGGRKAQAQPSLKRKNIGSRDADSEPGDDDVPRKRNIEPRHVDQNVVLSLLACLFHKFDCKYFGPDSAQTNYHTCAKARFKDVAQLKQHLLRDHCLPANYCVNCCETFSAKSLLDAHTVEKPRCERLEPPLYPDRITSQLSEALRLKPEDGREPRGQPPNQYWHYAYDLLFPGAAALVPVTPEYEGPDREHTLRFMRFARTAKLIVLPRVFEEEQRRNLDEPSWPSVARISEVIDHIVLEWYSNQESLIGLVLGQCIGSYVDPLMTVPGRLASPDTTSTQDTTGDFSQIQDAADWGQVNLDADDSEAFDWFEFSNSARQTMPDINLDDFDPYNSAIFY